ncbi:MAG: response regulator [Elusimicrobia bacterium]|nr:response regulator [Elusimicrobiota bacterium]
MNRILAADDDSGAREFYRICLEDAGFTVETVEDATAAIIKCLDFMPDLLLLDADMGGGGGEKVFEKIRGLLGKDIPVIFVTGLPERVKSFASKKNVLILQKPVSVDVLVREVNRLLAESWKQFI